MINLLPSIEHKTLESLYKRRLATVYLAVFAVLMLVALVLSLTSWQIFTTRADTLEEGLARTEESPVAGEVKELVALVRETNADAKLLLEDEADPVGDVLLTIIESKNTGIDISTFTYDSRGVVILKGEAERRDDLIAFVDRLEDLEFENVESPISNLIDNSDISFSVSINLETEE